MTVRALDDGYELDDDPSRVDIAAAHAYLGGTQGRGFGMAVLRMMTEESGFDHVRGLLGTRDAHSLYRPMGFETPSQRIMERPRTNPPARG